MGTSVRRTHLARDLQHVLRVRLAYGLGVEVGLELPRGRVARAEVAAEAGELLHLSARAARRERRAAVFGGGGGFEGGGRAKNARRRGRGRVRAARVGRGRRAREGRDGGRRDGRGEHDGSGREAGARDERRRAVGCRAVGAQPDGDFWIGKLLFP
eukprot:29705-Pelagococcus_subviridis.AAC.6